MTKLDHLTIRVRDLDAARSWYVGHLGLKLEFEVPGRRTVALQDDGGLTLFLDETAGDVAADGVVLTFQVDDVEETHRRLVAAGVSFVAPPGKRFWGYGAELRTRTDTSCSCGTRSRCGRRAADPYRPAIEQCSCVWNAWRACASGSYGLTATRASVR